MIRYVATNLTDLHKEPSFISELLTQVTNGVALEVQKEDGKFCYVRQTDGYEGWAYAPFLTDSPPLRQTHIVRFPQIPVIDKPKMSLDNSVVTQLLAGTSLHVADRQDEWCRI